ncbi:MAG: metalloregulator ArsR/SmtB family transcription factor [Candidatus Kapabacteria bacterium]|nr:metalloregulator ArsR/SmtB family transcription factor [Candidatus Kapabacteria bacterium]
MSENKKVDYTEDEIRMARYAKALSHPARLAILNILSTQSKCFCGDIVSELPLAQSTVSQHLKELKDSGLIHGEIEPPKVCYCLNPTEWYIAKKLFKKFFE